MEKPRPQSDPPEQRVICISAKLADRLERLHQHPICRALPDIERIAELVMALGTMELEQSIDAPVPRYNVIHGAWWLTLRLPEAEDSQALALHGFLCTVLQSLTVDTPRGLALHRMLARFIEQIGGPGFIAPAVAP